MAEEKKAGVTLTDYDNQPEGSFKVDPDYALLDEKAAERS